ncbi:multiple cyclophane-containing RiPP AmcA [Micromonospora sp. NPDC049900]|uniref:multiple cyclophane-containing RiPP AmcA n=1 Tax=Micromonospora sp. NPDC049900 TaxID=3364275 RepID=UPI00378A8B3D
MGGGGGGGAGGGGRAGGGGGGGGPPPPPPPPPTNSGSEWGPAVSVYVSRNAKLGDLPRDRSTSAPPVQPGPADPPLLTHVWRTVFERQARKRGPR